MNLTTRFFRRALPLGSALALIACGGSSTGPRTGAYDIELIWLGTPPGSTTQESFEVAERRIEQTIVGPVQTVAIPPEVTNLSQCGLPGHPDIKRDNIPGLRIYAIVEPIDDVGGTLGSAGPCLIRNNDQPALGYMRFDSADLANLQSQGRLTQVVLHEMLHVVGIGTVWYDAFVDTTTNPSDVRYTGTAARAACVDDNGGAAACGTTVPIESAAGVGSRFSHWRESVFRSELMTPSIGPNFPMPFSGTSVGALEDLGYEVTYSLADPFVIPTPLLDTPAVESTEGVIVLPEPMRPTFKLDGAGRLRPYRPRR